MELYEKGLMSKFVPELVVRIQDKCYIKENKF